MARPALGGGAAAAGLMPAKCHLAHDLLRPSDPTARDDEHAVAAGGPCKAEAWRPARWAGSAVQPGALHSAVRLTHHS